MVEPDRDPVPGFGHHQPGIFPERRAELPGMVQKCKKRICPSRPRAFDSSSANEVQADFGGERFELVTVGRQRRGAQSFSEGDRETVRQRNPFSLRLECSRSLPERRVEIGPDADSRGEHGGNASFGCSGSARPVEVIEDLAGVCGMHETVVGFVPDDLPDSLSAGFAPQRRDDSAGVKNVCQRSSPL